MRLRELRGNKTQEEVARDLGMTQKTYSNYETGATEPTLSVIIKMAEYFGVSPNFLCEYRPQSSPKNDIDRTLNLLCGLFYNMTPQNRQKLLGYANGLIDCQED